MNGSFSKIEVMKPKYNGIGNDEFRDLGYGAVRLDGELYIYLNGQILGPVQKILRRVHVQCDSGQTGSAPPVVMFGEGKKVGLYVNGVRSELFDEISNFKFQQGHFCYHARRGKKWCFVIDGIRHPWYDELTAHWIWLKKTETGTDVIYWARRNSKVAFWLNDKPLELFDAENEKISGLRWLNDDIAFEVEQHHASSRKRVGVWFNGEVLRWFDELTDFSLSLTSNGLSFIGINKAGRHLFSDGTWFGPYDGIEHYGPDRLRLPEKTLVATFKNKDKEFAQVGEWRTGNHDKIKCVEYSYGHRLIIGFDKLSGIVELYTYYVDEQKYCSVSDKDFYIRDGNLCFKKECVTKIPIRQHQ